MVHDKLVCLKKGANTGNNLCHVCDVSFDESDNEYIILRYTRMNDLIAESNKNGTKRKPM